MSAANQTEQTARMDRGGRNVLLAPALAAAAGVCALAWLPYWVGDRSWRARCRHPKTDPGHRPVAVIPRGAESTRWLWFTVRGGFAALAVWVAVTEPWDANGDGGISIHEALLAVVRFLAFPLHLLLSLTPAPVLHALGLPDPYWPSSALLAVVVSLPLWGLLLIGGLLGEAWLERASCARRPQKDT